LVFPKYRAVIFIHGCLWHRHECELFRWPKTNEAFWREKINRNSKNDKRNLTKLSTEGWRVLTVWECSLRGKRRVDQTILVGRIAHWLRSTKKLTEL